VRVIINFRQLHLAGADPVDLAASEPMLKATYLNSLL